MVQSEKSPAQPFFFFLSHGGMVQILSWTGIWTQNIDLHDTSVILAYLPGPSPTLPLDSWLKP